MSREPEHEDAQEASTHRRSSGRRALILSLSFPAVAWFFGSLVGLAVSLAAVAMFWVAPRPVRLYWPIAVALLAATPFAVWAQGLPNTKVVGATFGARHWVATDLVVAALVIASFAALVELLHLDLRPRERRMGPQDLARRIAEGMKERFEGDPAEASPRLPDQDPPPQDRDSRPG
jgi:hypothetical protein